MSIATMAKNSSATAKRLRSERLGGFADDVSRSAAIVACPVETLTVNVLGVPGETVIEVVGAMHVAFAGAPLHVTV
jgi:hypothetical protein